MTGESNIHHMIMQHFDLWVSSTAAGGRGGLEFPWVPGRTEVCCVE